MAKATPFFQGSQLVTPETITPNFSAEVGTHILSDYGHISQMDAGAGSRPNPAPSRPSKRCYGIGLGDSHVA